MEHTLLAQKSARYFTYGEPSTQTKQVWFVCHGYGQLAEYFLRNFHALNPTEHFIVAPEGFHRYYLNGHSGRVGASWMTKEDRLNDIKDYVHFLDQVYEKEINQFERENVQVNVLGFSQGGATVSRWVCLGNVIPNNLYLWATVFPPDLNFEVEGSKLKNVNVKIIVGDNDEFISENQVAEHSKELSAKGVNFDLIRFSGEHKIYQEVLKSLI